MRVEVVEEPASALAEYGRVPIAFEVRRILDVSAPGDGLGGLVLTERAVDAPYVKDYDAIAGCEPARWAERFDVSRWAFFAARVDDRRVGGAVVAFGTPGVEMLEGRRDLAVLWDIRVAPDARGQGVGAALIRAAEAWAVARRCRWMKVETQNVNVPACRFYARQGYVLGAIHRFAYPGLPGEAQLLWYRDLPPTPEIALCLTIALEDGGVLLPVRLAGMEPAEWRALGAWAQSGDRAPALVELVTAPLPAERTAEQVSALAAELDRVEWDGLGAEALHGFAALSLFLRQAAGQRSAIRVELQNVPE